LFFFLKTLKPWPQQDLFSKFLRKIIEPRKPQALSLTWNIEIKTSNNWQQIIENADQLPDLQEFFPLAPTALLPTQFHFDLFPFMG